MSSSDGESNPTHQSPTEPTPGRWQRHLYPLVLFFGSTLLYYLAFRVHGLLALPALALLFHLLDRTAPRSRLGVSLAWGLVFSALFYSWALHYGPLPWLGLILARGVPWVLLAIPKNLSEKLTTRPLKTLLPTWGLGLALVSFALLLGPTGVDWETPAGAFASWPWTLATLPYLGLVGFAFLFGTIASWMTQGFGINAGAALLMLTLWIALSRAIFSFEQVERPRGLRIALLQTGWSQEEKWDAKARQRAKDYLHHQTTQVTHRGSELVVWPETAWPNRGMRKRFSDTRAIGKLARERRTQILATSIEETDDKRWINSVSQVGQDGKFLSWYQKSRLAPFAEFLPLPQALENRLRAVAPFSYIGNFVPGSEQPVMEIGRYRYGILICYESMVPWPSRKVAKDVDFFVIVTNDAPMREEAPKEDHFRSAVLRAAQFRKFVFQASNNGVSGVIDNRATVHLRTPKGFSGAKTLEYPPRWPDELNDMEELEP